MTELKRDFAVEIAAAEQKLDDWIRDTVPMDIPQFAGLLSLIGSLQEQYIAELEQERRDAYEFMRSEVNRLETFLSTAMIGLEQVQIAAKAGAPSHEIEAIVVETFSQISMGNPLNSTKTVEE